MGAFDAPEQIALPGVVKTAPGGAAVSPMEERFLAALLATGVFRAAPAVSDMLVAIGPLGMVLRQLPVTCAKHRYRIDFAIVAHDGRPWIACEVDGFAFHSSKEQIVYDRQRERALTAAGWTVLRFTGTEVHRDAEACVLEVIAMLERQRAEVG
ncbi:MAG TPA: DUF559 domain-containing protein [Polyangiaceae bacterium]|nr:DUF559 domain-containing protein [Polyangiaceae bacterium]